MLERIVARLPRIEVLWSRPVWASRKISESSWTLRYSESKLFPLSLTILYKRRSVKTGCLRSYAPVKVALCSHIDAVNRCQKREAIVQSSYSILNRIASGSTILGALTRMSNPIVRGYVASTMEEAKKRNVLWILSISFLASFGPCNHQGPCDSSSCSCHQD